MNHVTKERISDRFCQYGNCDFDRTIDKLHSKLRDIIRNREVPYNLVRKENVVIDEMKSIGNDEVEVNDDEEMDENV